MQLTVQKTFQRLVFNSLATSCKISMGKLEPRLFSNYITVKWGVRSKTDCWLGSHGYIVSLCVCVCLQDKCGVILFSHCLNFIAQFTFTPSIKVCKVFFFSDSFSKPTTFSYTSRYTVYTTLCSLYVDSTIINYLHLKGWYTVPGWIVKGGVVVREAITKIETTSYWLLLQM